MFSWLSKLVTRLPKTGRALFIGIFKLCVVVDGLVALYELFYQHDNSLADWAIFAAIATSLFFAVAYGLYCTATPGDYNRDSLNGRRSPPTGRAAMRFMGIFCAMLFFASAIAGATTLEPQALIPLFGVFVTIFALGILSRFYAAKVSLDDDLGIIVPKKD